MAEPNRPAADTSGEEAAPATPSEPELLAPPTDEELAESGEPTAEEIHAAAGGDQDGRDDRAVVPPVVTEPAAAEPAAEAQPLPPRAPEADADEPAPAPAPPVAPPPPAAPAPPVTSQPELAPAEEAAALPPRARGNRVVGTAWVLLAAGLFQVLYFAALALIVLLLGGAPAVAPELVNIAKFPFAWLPVLFFFLFFELTVLLVNRAGRFTYVVGSLIVGLLVYIASVLLISILVGGSIGDSSTLAQAFESPEFVLTGLVAREVMLWTGFAIGSRGIRVRLRNKEARARYDEELADA